MSPTVPACAFASLSNGINNSAAAQMLMTSNGQVFPSLASSFGGADNVANFKVAIPNDQNCSSNLMINTSPTLMKDEIQQALQMTPLASLAPTQTSSVLVNGTAKIGSNDDTSLPVKIEQNGDNTTSLSPEVRYYRGCFVAVKTICVLIIIMVV